MCKFLLIVFWLWHGQREVLTLLRTLISTDLDEQCWGFVLFEVATAVVPPSSSPMLISGTHMGSHWAAASQGFLAGLNQINN